MTDATPQVSAEGDLSLEGRPEQVLAFVLGGEPHAVALDRIRLVQRAEDIRPLPQAPDDVIGMIEVLDEAVPVVNLSKVLGLAEAENPEHVLVYNSAKGLVGFVVDEARGVVSATRAPLPQTLRRGGACLVALARHGDETAYLLDLEAVLPGPVGMSAARKGGSSTESESSGG